VGHRKKNAIAVRTHVARKARTEIERCSFRSERLRGQLRDPPSSAAAEQLGQIAETEKRFERRDRAVRPRLRLIRWANGTAGRRDPAKLGNVWRLTPARTSELGEYLLLTLRRGLTCIHPARPRKNAGCSRTRRFHAQESSRRHAFPPPRHERKSSSPQFLGHVVRPLPPLEPLFAHVGRDFRQIGVLFLAANCDEDEVSGSQLTWKSTSHAPPSYFADGSTASSLTLLPNRDGDRPHWKYFLRSDGFRTRIV